MEKMEQTEQPEQMVPTDVGKSNRKSYAIIQRGKQTEKIMKEILYLDDGKTSKIVLFRLQRQKQASVHDPAWTARLLAHLTIAASKSSGAYDKKGRGSWNFLSPGDLASPPGSRKIL